jgi:hypothetical protein
MTDDRTPQPNTWPPRPEPHQAPPPDRQVWNPRRAESPGPAADPQVWNPRRTTRPPADRQVWNPRRASGPPADRQLWNPRRAGPAPMAAAGTPVPGQHARPARRGAGRARRWVPVIGTAAVAVAGLLVAGAVAPGVRLVPVVLPGPAPGVGPGQHAVTHVPRDRARPDYLGGFGGPALSGGG